jgi:8-oxo-dGTP pyrophosphatase MutT (NUDIX family)
MADFLLNEGRLRPADAAAALILVGEEKRYLLQLRDQKPGIFFPGHWGLFGGATDPGESPERSLRRELAEELKLAATELRYFTEFEFDFAFCGLGRFKRLFYEVRILESSLSGLVLCEGAEMRAFTAPELFDECRLVPFDAFAIWLHAARHTALRP